MHSVGLTCKVGVSNIWNKFNRKKLKQTDHWIVRDKLKLLSCNIVPNTRSYIIVLILKLTRFRLCKALLKGLQKGMVPSKVFDLKLFQNIYGDSVPNKPQPKSPSYHKIKDFQSNLIMMQGEKSTNSCQSCKNLFSKKMHTLIHLSEHNTLINLTLQCHRKATS